MFSEKVFALLNVIGLRFRSFLLMYGRATCSSITSLTLTRLFGRKAIENKAQWRLFKPARYPDTQFQQCCCWKCSTFNQQENGEIEQVRWNIYVQFFCATLALP